MSGGSYNYLCNADGEDLYSRSSDLRAMADRLAALGYAEDAARETEELICFLNQARVRTNVRLARLHSVWRAIEWWDSGDYGENQLKEALAKYRGKIQ